MQPSGYSGTPLEKKLGIKTGFKIRLINPPENYFDFFEHFPTDVKIVESVGSLKNLIHFFPGSLDDIEKKLPKLKNEIELNGMIWISWAKKTSKIISDINEDGIRDIAFRNGLVDIKVCAVSEIWSALKLVIPIKDRIKNL